MKLSSRGIAISTVLARLIATVISDSQSLPSLSTISQPGLHERAQIGDVPSCGKTCLDSLPKNICSASVAQALQACAATSCSVGDGLLTQRYQAETCNIPVRDKGGFYRRFTWAMFTLASLFVLARFLSRTRSLGGTGYSWDDWVVLAMYALLIPADVSGEMEVQNGLCQDIYMLTVPRVANVLKWFYIGEINYNVIIMGTKVSLLLLYLRIWTPDSVSRVFRPICWSLIALISATAIAGAFAIAFQCSPVHLAWLAITGEVKGHCINLTAFTYTYAALNILYDVIVILLPIRNLMKLNISIAKKIGICSVFLVGFLVTICSLVRLQYLVKLGDSKNITWDFQYIGMWSLVETNFSMVCCCMPAMAGLVQRIWMKCCDPTRPSFSKSTKSAGSNLVVQGSNADHALTKRASESDPAIEMQYKHSVEHNDENFKR